MYDCIIIGNGVAGASCAINLQLRGKNFIWLGLEGCSKKVRIAPEIKNVVGLESITGKEFEQNILAQIKALGITQTQGIVSNIYDMEGYYIASCGAQTYEGKTIVLCVGVGSDRVIDGEENFLGRGVSYCATCDGMLYKGKDIAIICYDKHFEEEIDFLSNIANRVYVSPMYAGFTKKRDNQEVIMGVKKIEGGMKVNTIVYKDTEKSVDGVFILKSSFAPSAILPQLKIEKNHIAVDRSQATSVKGVFAAGDCTGAPYQYAKAMGEGNVAAHSVIEYLENLE